MTDFQPDDAEVIDRLRAEFRQPVPTEISQAHLGRIQKITASQALSVRNRYRASLAVAAAAVGLFGLQLSTSMFSPSETLAPAAAPTTTPTTEPPPLVAQVDPEQQESDDETRQLIGRPAAATDAGGDGNEVEASVAVLDSVSGSEVSSEPEADDPPSTNTTTVTNSGVSVTTSANEPNTDTDTGTGTESRPADSVSLATSTTVRSTQATTVITIATTTTTPDAECEELEKQGNGNGNALRQGGPYSPTTASSFPGQSGPAECKSNSSAAKSNSIQGSDNGVAQGLQPK